MAAMTIRAKRLLAEFNATDYADTARRLSLLREMLGSICRTYALPVRIEDNVWIGGGAIILPGVTIGRGSTIGAGSVVTRSIPAGCVAVGNPCRVIRRLDSINYEID